MADSTVSTERRSPVSVLRIAYAPLLIDNKEALEYGEMVDMGNTLISAGYSPQMQNNQQFASGQQYDSYTSKTGGNVDIQTPGLNGADEKGLLGTSYNEKTGLIKSNKKDVIPYVGTVYSTENSDGTVNLYRFYKVKYSTNGETVTTKDSSGVTFQATTLNGQYIPLRNNGDDMDKLKGLDPVKDKEIIDAWFEKMVPDKED